jgi:type II secretory ATPase GspE/PulE/Tfp pilus assembly ATPase PilB-like protein
MPDSDLQLQLSKMKREAEERDAQRRAQTLGVSYLPPEKVSINLEALALLSEHEARDAQCVIIAMREKTIALAAYDTSYSKTKIAVKKLKDDGYTITQYIISLASLARVLEQYKFVSVERTAISGEVGVETTSDITISSLDTIPKTKTAIETHIEGGKLSTLMEIILMGAIANRASDIHIEPKEDSARLRYRVDGLLVDIMEFSREVYRPVISRIKLLANLKLNIRDQAQDGRFTIDFKNKTDVEVRVAVAPSEFGEVAVMRVLDSGSISLDLKDLGLRQDDLEIIHEQLKRPNGMALNTGPTGSGKTTTLYAFLRHRLSSEVKIITIEDPIEYHLDGIEQTQVSDEGEYTFASGLRSLMRQDPDIILVGEIRDKETAEIAVQAALTGHLVFSTVHANEATGAVPRLLDLGVKANSLAPALNLLIAQRLVRRLCTKCRKEKPIDEAMRKNIQTFVQNLPARVDKKAYESISLYEPVGCEYCNNMGYRGRVGVYELLVVDTSLQELIGKEAGQVEIDKVVKTSEFVSMRDDGILKAIQGITTLEEVEEITGKIVWK